MLTIIILTSVLAFIFARAIVGRPRDLTDASREQMGYDYRRSGLSDDSFVAPFDEESPDEHSSPNT